VDIKSDTVYNQADNKVFIKSNGEEIVVICDTEEKLQHVQKKFHEAGNSIIEFEEWDEGEDKKYIVTFSVDEEPVLN
jgi:siroheme synthase (precorrin-2 oxidase/ferrochelatase)